MATEINDANISDLVHSYLHNKNALPDDLKNIPIGKWKWKSEDITNLEQLFSVQSVDDYNQEPGFNEDINDWIVSDVTNMFEMFDGANDFNQPLDKWNVSKVEIMTYMFSGAKKFNQPLNMWGDKLKNVKDMTMMFAEATDFNQTLDTWDFTDLIQNKAMYGIFYKTGLTIEIIKTWNNLKDLDEEDYYRFFWIPWEEYSIINNLEINALRDDLTDKDLTYINFGDDITESESLNNIFSNNANLVGINLSYSNVHGLMFNDSILNYAKFIGAELTEANFTNSNLIGADLTGANMILTDLVGSDCLNANLSNTRLFLNNAISANFTGANFTGAILNDLELQESVFIKANFTKATIVGDINLSGVDFTNAKFIEAILTGIDFTNAIISKSDFTKANLTGATLPGLNLQDVIKRTGAKFNEAILTNVIYALPGVAFEVHDASSKINFNKLLEILDENVTEANKKELSDNINKPEFVKYLQQKLIDYIEGHPTEFTENTVFSGVTTSKYINELNTIFDRVITSKYNNNPEYKNIMGKSIFFVLNQDAPFIHYYIKSFIKDCYYAYTGTEERPVEPGQGVSCTKGIVERFYMYIGDAVRSQCPEKDECVNPTYIKLIDLFETKDFFINQNINQIFGEWSPRLDDDHPNHEEFKKLTVNERKEDFILFFQEKYKEANEINIDEEIPSKIRFKINAIAEEYNRVFKELRLGGGQIKGKINRKSTKSTKSNKNKTKKSTKSNKNKTNKKNKTKKSTKSNKKNKTKKNKTKKNKKNKKQ